MTNYKMTGTGFGDVVESLIEDLSSKKPTDREIDILINAFRNLSEDKAQVREFVRWWLSQFD